jgi:hypothetical protein
MLRLDIASEPAWFDLVAGVRVKASPLTTALMMAARNDEAVRALLPDASDEERSLAFCKAVARRAILEWQGVGDAQGEPLPPSAAGIDALMEIWPVFEAFQLRYVAKGLALEAEKNDCAPLPNGISARAEAIAKPAQGHARNARRS